MCVIFLTALSCNKKHVCCRKRYLAHCLRWLLFPVQFSYVITEVSVCCCLSETHSVECISDLYLQHYNSLLVISPTLVVFLEGGSIACYAVPCISCVVLSVHLSQARITKSAPMNSPRTLVLALRSSSRNLKGFTPTRALNESGIRKIHNFQPISRHISEMVHAQTKVTINDY